MIAAVIVAAGRGRRMGHTVPKQFLPLCGKPVIAHTLSRFEDASRVDGIVVVTPPGGEDETASSIVRRYGFRKIASVVPGGSSRQESVRRGLDALGEDCRVVLIHDAVRPMVDERMINQCIDAAEDVGAAAIAVRMTDTVKESDEAGMAVRTLERGRLWRVQTPQGFRLDLIREAHRRAEEDGFTATDDASLVERLGQPVKLVEGSLENIKITTPEDLLVAEAILGMRLRQDG